MANYNHFLFKGEKYYAGTIVEVNETAPHPYPYTKYAMFEPNSTLFIAMSSPTDFFQNGKWLMSLKEEDIKQIVSPVRKSDIKYVKKYNDTECNDMFFAWGSYIAAMFFSLFLNIRIIAWIFFTILFVSYRHDKLYTTKTPYDKNKRKG